MTKKIELKRDPLVIVPYTIFTLALFVLLAMKLITWLQLLAGLAALNLPAVFGLTRAGDDSAKAKSDPPPPISSDIKTPRDGRGALSVLIFVGAVMLAGHVVACGHGSTACAVVDVAKSNCDLWIRYLEEDGSTREVRLTRDEATALARTTAKKRAAERDGGAP